MQGLGMGQGMTKEPSSIRGQGEYLNYTENIHQNLNMMNDILMQLEGLLASVIIKTEGEEVATPVPDDPTELGRVLQALFHKSELVKSSFAKFKDRIRI